MILGVGSFRRAATAVRSGMNITTTGVLLMMALDTPAMMRMIGMTRRGWRGHNLSNALVSGPSASVWNNACPTTSKARMVKRAGLAKPLKSTSTSSPSCGNTMPMAISKTIAPSATTSIVRISVAKSTMAVKMTAKLSHMAIESAFKNWATMRRL